MAAPSDTSLQTRLRFNLSTNYFRTDNALVPRQIRDNLSTTVPSELWLNGRGDSRANLQWYDRRRLINTSESLDLDGVLVNQWGETLDYDSVKLLYLRNTSADDVNLLDYTFKHERGILSAGGVRIIVEPVSIGVQSTVSSGSTEEGQITLNATGDVTYDIIIIGSDKEESSSSSGQ